MIFDFENRRIDQETTQLQEALWMSWSSGVLNSELGVHGIGIMFRTRLVPAKAGALIYYSAGQFLIKILINVWSIFEKFSKIFSIFDQKLIIF